MMRQPRRMAGLATVFSRDFCMYDIAVLTDGRYVAPDDNDWYIRQIHQEDGLVADALRRQGLSVVRRDWADPDVDWSDCRALLFRTTWDYFDRFAEFSPWLEQVSGQCRLFNEAALIRWNIDKHYLGDLAATGVNITPTWFIGPGDARTLAEHVAACGWPELILKPAVSGAARHTYRFAAGDAGQHQAVFAELIAVEAMLLQPFQQSVLEQGEISLMVMDGRVSHAIRKTPKANDFRVQDDHGGTVHAHEASAEEIAFAEAAVAAVPFDVIYARVDVIRDNAGQLAIMELEMVEPELFFRFHPAAADQLAAGIARRLAA
jgi:glutathione synthase/RimK-type ligase-like ATP-grasp enzyme